jgi:hypothetical protein
LVKQFSYCNLHYICLGWVAPVFWLFQKFIDLPGQLSWDFDRYVTRGSFGRYVTHGFVTSDSLVGSGSKDMDK